MASVGADTWGVDYVLLSKSGELLGQPFHYRDARTDGVMEPRLRDRVPRAEIYAATGVQFLPFNTLYQLLAAREQTPELLAAADRLLLMPDFLHWCLCGSTAVEFTNATTTQLYDPAAADWARDLIRRFGLPRTLFGEVVPPGTVLGDAPAGVDAETGLGGCRWSPRPPTTRRRRSPRSRPRTPAGRLGVHQLRDLVAGRRRGAGRDLSPRRSPTA